MCVFIVAAFIVFMNIKPFGKELHRLLQRINNTNDPHGISVIMRREAVGHVPSTECVPFLELVGTNFQLRVYRGIQSS